MSKTDALNSLSLLSHIQKVSFAIKKNQIDPMSVNFFNIKFLFQVKKKVKKTFICQVGTELCNHNYIVKYLLSIAFRWVEYRQSKI